MSVTDTERLSHPTTATTAQNEDRAREQIPQNRRVMVNKTAKQLNISIGSAYSVVHDNLQLHKVCARWVPKELTNEHKCVRLDICYHHLAHYGEECDNFLQQIITGDVTWVHHYQPDTKWNSMQWKHPSSSVAKKFETQPSAGKLMLSTFWDSQGPILETSLKHGITATNATSCDMHQSRLKPVNCSKRRGKLSEGILLLQ
jgi:hypothetical protein